MAKKKTRYVIIQVPEAAWKVLHDHLEMDEQSGSFDRDLRKEIGRALDAIYAIGLKEVGKRWPLEERWTLKMPAWAWDTIAETLNMDMTSKWTPKELREPLEAAYEQIEVIE